MPIHEEAPILSYQRDRFVETSDLVLPFEDDFSGTIRGYRVFTACRTVNGKVFRLDDHLARLYSSAANIHMEPPMPRVQLKLLVEEVARKNFETYSQGDFVIEVMFSGGLLGTSMKPSGAGAHLYIAAQPLERPSAEQYRDGIALATFPHQRMLPDVKLLNYVGAIVAHQTVVPQQNAYDVLFVDPVDAKTILEGSTFTMFFVDSDGKIVTPPLDGRILDSITRRVLLEILEPRQDLTVLEQSVLSDELAFFPEAFLASTTRSVLPVTRIDKTLIGDGVPGPVTKTVMNVFDEYLTSY